MWDAERCRARAIVLTGLCAAMSAFTVAAASRNENARVTELHPSIQDGVACFDVHEGGPVLLLNAVQPDGTFSTQVRKADEVVETFDCVGVDSDARNSLLTVAECGKARKKRSARELVFEYGGFLDMLTATWNFDGSVGSYYICPEP